MEEMEMDELLDEEEEEERQWSLNYIQLAQTIVDW